MGVACWPVLLQTQGCSPSVHRTLLTGRGGILLFRFILSISTLSLLSTFHLAVPLFLSLFLSPFFLNYISDPLRDRISLPSILAAAILNLLPLLLFFILGLSFNQCAVNSLLVFCLELGAKMLNV